MILNFLYAMWAAIAPALGNHVWQSTLFAVIAGLLTLILRKNHARARYWLWLAASVKFLIPFSLLTGVGSHLALSRGSAGANAGLYVAMEEVGQPFTQPTLLAISRAAPTTAFSNLIQALPAVLAVVWLCGFVVVVCVWYERWRRISAAIREATPLREGREVEALRRLERSGGMPKGIELRLSRSSLEPGIFGNARPVLVWPLGISERLEDGHLEAILAHELWHVRRRDNLAAALHMVVEAIFWFHPLVWWLGTRLVEERERACDEEVLESGSDRQVYAESILKICEFCVGSPLACVSGVTGADLKKRIVRIMTERVARKLDFSRKLLLGAAGLVAFCMPVMFGLVHATQSRGVSQGQSTPAIAALRARSVAEEKLAFEAASVRPNTSVNQDNSMSVPLGSEDVSTGGLLSGTNARLISYIYFAYNLTGNQLQLLMPQLPKWVISDRFDIQARAEGKPTKAQMRLMMQSLLADRFKLAIHYETRQLPVFALVLAKPGKIGPQIQWHPDDSSCSAAPPPTSSGSAPKRPATVAGGFPSVCGGIEGMPSSPPGRLRVGARNVPIGLLAATLAQMGNLDRAVLDRTGLSGTFDFTFEWKPQFSGPGTPNGPPPLGANARLDESGATFLEDLREQLGLKLESQKGPVEVLVIDHVERPAEPQAQNVDASAHVYDAVSIKPDQSGTAALQTGKGVIRQRLMILPGEFTSTNNTLQGLIKLLYGVEDYQISGAPHWLNSEMYDIEAKAGKSVVDELRKLSQAQRDLVSQRMAQALVEDRFQLKVHRENRETPIYSLVVADAGKLHEVQGDCGPPSNLPQPLPEPGKLSTLPLPCGNFVKQTYPDMGHLSGQKVPVKELVAELSQVTGRMVVDKTSLIGKYDMNLDWTPQPGQSWLSPRGTPNGAPPSSQPGPDDASLLTALQEQLGLKLEPQKAPIETLVIDHVERLSEIYRRE